MLSSRSVPRLLAIMISGFGNASTMLRSNLNISQPSTRASANAFVERRSHALRPGRVAYFHSAWKCGLVLRMSTHMHKFMHRRRRRHQVRSACVCFTCRKGLSCDDARTEATISGHAWARQVSHPPAYNPRDSLRTPSQGSGTSWLWSSGPFWRLPW